MRTIKFRGKRCDNGEWVYGYYVESHHSWRGHHPHKAWILADAITNGGFFALKGKRAVVNVSVGQFTGLLDKNGKEIYEGDIVKVTNLYTYVGIVQWDLCNPCMCISYKNKYGYEDIEYDFIKAGNMLIEVIGNIHDNPELLKGGEE